MKLHSQRELIRTVAARYEAQYIWQMSRSTAYVMKLEKLKALNVETATVGDVADIIGNGTWVFLHHCDSCGLRKDTVVELHDADSYEDSELRFVCPECVTKLMKLLAEAAKLIEASKS